MNIELLERTEEHVRIYYARTQNPKIRGYLPQTVTSLDQALTNYARTRQPNPSSYGATIYVDGTYAGDVWCYGISLSDVPQAMVSYCIFETGCWGRGIMTQALSRFLADIKSRFGIVCTGAFVYTENISSIRVLEKNGFSLREVFRENGIESAYYQAGDHSTDIPSGHHVP